MVTPVGGRISIIQAEKLLAESSAKQTFEMNRFKFAHMVTDDLRDFDFSFEVIDNNDLGITAFNDYLAPVKPTITEIIMRAKSSDELDSIKRGVAYIVLEQLGALYGGFKDHYDSPALGKNVELKWGRIISGSRKYTFDPNPVLEDIPALIKKSDYLTQQLREMKSSTLIKPLAS